MAMRRGYVTLPARPETSAQVDDVQEEHKRNARERDLAGNDDRGHTPQPSPHQSRAQQNASHRQQDTNHSRGNVGGWPDEHLTFASSVVEMRLPQTGDAGPQR